MSTPRPFIPFANESDVVQLGNMMVENRLDRITLNGDIDLTLDQIGLEHARSLQRLLGAVLARMEAQPLPAHLPAPDVKMVDNPFE